MWLVSGKCVLWNDELLSLDVAIQSSLKKALARNVELEGNGLLFNLILYFYYKICPYGIRWLLLLPEFFMALGVFSLGMCAKKVLGNHGGCFAAAVASMSHLLMIYGNNLRAYPLLILFISLTLWAYFVRLEHGNMEKRRELLVYGLCLAGLIYTFYLAAFVCVMLFIFDVILYFRKKVGKRCIYSYLICGALFLPWFIYFLTRNKLSTWSAYDAGFSDLFPMLKGLLDRNVVLLSLACLGIFIIIFQFIKKRDVKSVFLFLCGILIVVFIALNLIVVGLWENRYFFIILPMFVIIISHTLKELIDFIPRRSAFIAACLILVFLLYALPRNYQKMQYKSDFGTWVNNLKSAADWLLAQDDIYDNSTGLWHFIMFDAWNDYYVRQKEKRDSLDKQVVAEWSDVQNRKYYKIYAVYNQYERSDVWEHLSTYYDLILDDKNLKIKVWTLKPDSTPPDEKE
jgi:uncharacterized membrane protein